jgi:shikimate kinase
MNVVLLGYRGSGKTSAGRVLAERTGRAFVDADVELVRRAGRSIREIFFTDGEPDFRDLESAVLLDLLTMTNTVIALGGGVIVRETNRDKLLAADAARIYLRADAATLYRRIGADPATADNRPALTALGGSVREIETLLAAREPLYRSVATHELDVSGLCVDEVAAGLVKMIEPQMNADERG